MPWPVAWVGASTSSFACSTTRAAGAMSYSAAWVSASELGAHSPSLRPEGDAPTYLGRGAEFAARDPLQLITTKPDIARRYTWWIDDGDVVGCARGCEGLDVDVAVRGVDEGDQRVRHRERADAGAGEIGDDVLRGGASGGDGDAGG